MTDKELMKLVVDRYGLRHTREDVLHVMILFGSPRQWRQTFSQRGRSRGWYVRLYRAYLQSSAWARKRHQALVRDKFLCQRCHLCREATQVHHLTYERLGNESLVDLQSVCRTCHRRSHEKLSTQEQRLRLADMLAGI